MNENLPSTKPYMIRAMHEWCNDNGFTPHVVVQVDEHVRVPREFVKDGQIVLNIAYDATGGLQIGNEMVSFQARFGGVARDISFPVGNVLAIYARENGAGMAFDAEPPATGVDTHADADEVPEHPQPDPVSPPPGGRPKLQRVK